VTSLTLGRYAISICAAAAMLTGCGGSQPPIGTPGAMPQSSANATHAAHGGSWMLPEAKGEDLLYVSSYSWVSIYSYPQGKMVGKLHGFYLASGQCVDSAGDIYITDYGRSEVYKYAHGNSQRKRAYFTPSAIDCAIDPTTGNLAVVSWGGAGVGVFKNAAGHPTKYKDSNFLGYYGCGYDSKGNLFVDGISHVGSGNVVFAELPKAGRELKTVTLDQDLGWPGGVKWDGKHIAVGDGATPAIYEFVIKGRRATTVGTTPLGSGARWVHQFWLRGKTVLTSTSCYPHCIGARGNQAIQYFQYPAGGTATQMITTGLKGEPLGDSVSLAPSR
jgi:hypothetical protein